MDYDGLLHDFAARAASIFERVSLLGGGQGNKGR
jgi:hypothetical protein